MTPESGAHTPKSLLQTRLRAEAPPAIHTDGRDPMRVPFCGRYGISSTRRRLTSTRKICHQCWVIHKHGDTSSATGLAATLNTLIHDFVNAKANRRLRAGTGAYSTLFRGSLFGFTDDVSISKRLRNRRVDVLWLGANPCVPRSLDQIVAAPDDEGDFPAFLQQMRSGLFSSARWDDSGTPLPDFNPLERPKGNWQLYRDVLQHRLGTTEGVAMANVLPWGSSDIEDFGSRMAETDEGLLGRMLRFADELNVVMVSVLRPRLMIVPFSIGRSRRLHAIHPWQLSEREADSLNEHRLALEGRSFAFTTAISQRGSMRVPVAFLPHPAALRIPRTARSVFLTRVVEILGAASESR